MKKEPVIQALKQALETAYKSFVVDMKRGMNVYLDVLTGPVVVVEDGPAGNVWCRLSLSSLVSEVIESLDGRDQEPDAISAQAAAIEELAQTLEKQARRLRKHQAALEARVAGRIPATPKGGHDPEGPFEQGVRAGREWVAAAKAQPGRPPPVNPFADRPPSTAPGWEDGFSESVREANAGGSAGAD